MNRIENRYNFTGKDFEIIIKDDSFEVWTEGEKYFDLSVRTGLSVEDKIDLDETVLVRELTETNKGTTVVWKTRSNLWEQKEYILECTEDSFLYKLKVSGKGRLTKLDYFSGAKSPKACGSKYEVSRYLWPVAIGGGNENRYFTTAQNAIIELGYLVPPMYCFPFNLEDLNNWFGLGLAAKEGEYNFDSFSYTFNAPEVGVTRFYLSTDFKGHTVVDGEWETPGIVGIPGSDEFKVLENYSNWHFDSGYTKPWSGEAAEWWYGPFFCGWGEQCAKSIPNAFDYANQAEYEKMSARLDELDLKPTAIIIDDKWQTYYGEALPDTKKWPDLREFVDNEHAKGRKVILWFKAWNSEGLDLDECVHLWGQPVGADPTSPKYQERMRKTLYKLLSSDEGCYNCDGFKIDFANCMPLGKGIRTHEAGVYGVELLKRFFKMMYDFSKEVKPDVLINNSCCHPYFAEVTDQARLHDFFWGLRNSKTGMTFRAKLFEAALPGVIIDTDGATFCNYRDTMEYLKYAPQIGVPDLYQLSPNKEVALTDEDWKTVKKVWEEYSDRIKKEIGVKKK